MVSFKKFIAEKKDLGIMTDDKYPKLALIGVVKIYEDDEGEPYKYKVEYKNITSKYIEEFDQHDVYWDYDDNWDSEERISYDRWKYKINIGPKMNNKKIMWTDSPDKKSRELVLKTLKDKFNIIPEGQYVWTDFLEAERQRLILRDLDGD